VDKIGNKENFGNIRQMVLGAGEAPFRSHHYGRNITSLCLYKNSPNYLFFLLSKRIFKL